METGKPADLLAAGETRVGSCGHFSDHGRIGRRHQAALGPPTVGVLSATLKNRRVNTCSSGPHGSASDGSLDRLRHVAILPAGHGPGPLLQHACFTAAGLKTPSSIGDLSRPPHQHVNAGSSTARRGLWRSRYRSCNSGIIVPSTVSPGIPTSLSPSFPHIPLPPSRASGKGFRATEPSDCARPPSGAVKKEKRVRPPGLQARPAAGRAGCGFRPSPRRQVFVAIRYSPTPHRRPPGPRRPPRTATLRTRISCTWPLGIVHRATSNPVAVGQQLQAAAGSVELGRVLAGPGSPRAAGYLSAGRPRPRVCCRPAPGTRPGRRRLIASATPPCSYVQIGCGLSPVSPLDPPRRRRKLIGRCRVANQ